MNCCLLEVAVRNVSGWG